MEDQLSQVLEGIRQTQRCRSEVQEIAKRMAGLGKDDYRTLIHQLMHNGEDRPLGILLNVCALNGIRLEPDLLARTLTVVEPLTDFTLPYRFQDGSAIAALLEVAQGEDISWERQALAGRIAAELAVRFDSDRQPVRKALLKLKTKIRAPESQWLIVRSLSLLDGKEELLSPGPCLTQKDALKELPEEKDPLVIGAGFTVRRPVPKLNRNAPCHCGSGKKYKKCCYENDQQLLRDASPYQGMTMTQVRSAPEMVDDVSLISEMRAYELKKLDPARLNPDQLLAAYRQADLFGLRDLAYTMLLELEQRPGTDELDRGHFQDLLYSALDAGNVDLAERILAHFPPEELWDPESVKTNLHVLKHREHFETLELQCRKSLAGVDENLPDDPLVRLAYGLERTFPALSVVFARAFIVGDPDRHFDNDLLLDLVRSARADIGLDPVADPIEDYVGWWADEVEEEEEENWMSEELQRLGEEVADVRTEVEKKGRELQQKEEQLQELMSKMEEEKHQLSAGPRIQPVRPSEEPPRDKDTILRLRQRIESLKDEIRSQQEHRRQLRRQLQTEREKPPVPKRLGGIQERSPESDAPPLPAKEMKKVLVPEYAPAFHRACETMDPPVVAKALKASAGFAANDSLVWRQTKPVKRIPGFYRIRVEKDYRVMLRWEPDRKLEVLDLIPRSQLETWIRQHAP